MGTTQARIDYVEIGTTDIPGCKRFFSELFGWRFEDYSSDYTVFHDGFMRGGFCREEPSSASGPVLLVFHCRELESYLQKVRELGGVITRNIFSFPGGRRFQFTVPGCGEFAIWSEADQRGHAA